MGLFQDEALSDALKLTLAAGMLSSSATYSIPVQMPLVLFAPSLYYDLMNLTTTKPFMTLNLPQPIKTLQPPHVAIPFYAIFPACALQAQIRISPWVPPPCSLNSAFWDVVRNTVELSVYGVVALAWLLQVTKATPKKNLTCFWDDRELSSCDSLGLSFLPSIPPEDDLLRVDVTVLESIPSSELYLGEAESVTAVAAAPRLLSTRTKSPSCLQLDPSDATLATIPESFLSGENLSVLLQIPDDELYFNFEDSDKLGASLPWPLNLSATLSSA